MKKLKEKHAVQKDINAAASSARADEKQQTSASGNVEAGKAEDKSTPLTLELLAEQIAALSAQIEAIREFQNVPEKHKRAEDSEDGKENGQEPDSHGQEDEIEAENCQSFEIQQGTNAEDSAGGGAVPAPQGSGGDFGAAKSSQGGGAVSSTQGSGGDFEAVKSSEGGGGIPSPQEGGVAYKSPDANPMLQGSRTEAVTAEMVERARRDGYRAGRLDAIEESRRERVAYYQNLLDAGARAEGRMPQSRPTGQFLASPRRGFWEE